MSVSIPVNCQVVRKLPWLISKSLLEFKFFFKSAAPLSPCWEIGGLGSSPELIGGLPSASPAVTEHLSLANRANVLASQQCSLLPTSSLIFLANVLEFFLVDLMGSPSSWPGGCVTSQPGLGSILALGARQ